MIGQNTRATEASARLLVWAAVNIKREVPARVRRTGVALPSPPPMGWLFYMTMPNITGRQSQCIKTRMQR